MAAAGAPTYLVGFLVPVREALALLPQVFIARVVSQARVRRWFWVGGSVGQAISLVGIAASLLVLSGAAAGWAVVGCLALFSLCRAVSSVSIKDVMGRTLARGTRGRASGYAAAIGGAVVLILGLLSQLDQRPADPAFFAILFAAAAALWVLAAALFSAVREDPADCDDGRGAVTTAVRSLRLAWREPHLRLFLITRALLMSTALAAPFYVDLARRASDGTLGTLGLLVIATGVARAGSSALWGRFADASSRRAMVAAGALAALSGSLTVAVHLAGLDNPWLYAGLLLGLSVAHAGVRIGRSTYLIDMADDRRRATYTAVSNTVIGVLILAAGILVAVFAGLAGPAWTIALLAGVSAVAAWIGRRLPELA